MASHGIGHCANCRARLEIAHRYCWNCGLPRWAAPLSGPPQPCAPRPATGERPPPTPGTSVFANRPAVAPPAQSGQPNLGLLPWFYAAGAVLFLFDAVRGAAYLASPGGRSQLLASLARQGADASTQQGVITFCWLVLGGCVAVAALHGVAFYGLRRLRLWGWISALVVAIVWSLLIVGIPVLLRLVSRDVRRAFGVD